MTSLDTANQLVPEQMEMPPPPPASPNDNAGGGSAPTSSTPTYLPVTAREMESMLESQLIFHSTAVQHWKLRNSGYSTFRFFLELYLDLLGMWTDNPSTDIDMDVCRLKCHVECNANHTNYLVAFTVAKDFATDDAYVHMANMIGNMAPLMRKHAFLFDSFETANTVVNAVEAKCALLAKLETANCDVTTSAHLAYLYFTLTRSCYFGGRVQPQQPYRPMRKKAKTIKVGGFTFGLVVAACVVLSVSYFMLFN